MRSSLQLELKTPIGKSEAKKVQTIIITLSQCTDSIDFREPVDWKAMGLTDYSYIVRYPMDLGTVAKNYKRDKYNFVEEVFDDIQLIWDNCKLYNPPNSWIHSIAQKLQRYFRKISTNYFPELQIPVPVKSQESNQNKNLPNYSMFEQDEDIRYDSKLAFSQKLSLLSSANLDKVVQEIIKNCPSAYKDLGGQEENAQILVDNMDLLFFTELNEFIQKLEKGEDKFK